MPTSSNRDARAARPLLPLGHGVWIFGSERTLRRPQLRWLWHDAGPSRHPIAPRGTRRSDEELYEDLCEALMHRDEVDSSDVAVAVHEGEVMLAGSVPRRYMRYLIEDLAAGHPAVRDVDNRITVRKP
jgi:hypothetical protein